VHAGLPHRLRNVYGADSGSGDFGPPKRRVQLTRQGPIAGVAAPAGQETVVLAATIESTQARGSMPSPGSASGCSRSPGC
jgi:hypothetical protein